MFGGFGEFFEELSGLGDGEESVLGDLSVRKLRHAPGL